MSQPESGIWGGFRFSDETIKKALHVAVVALTTLGILATLVLVVLRAT